MRKLSIMLIVVLVFAMAAGCTGSRATARTNWHIGEPKDLDETLIFDANRDFDRLTLKVDIGLSSGALTFIAFDPQGNEIWNKTLEQEQNLSQTRSFEPELGEWQVHIQATEVTGSISFIWRGTR